MIVTTTREPFYAVEGLTRTQIGWLIVFLRNVNVSHPEHVDRNGARFAGDLLTQCQQEVKL